MTHENNFCAAHQLKNFLRCLALRASLPHIEEKKLKKEQRPITSLFAYAGDLVTQNCKR